MGGTYTLLISVPEDLALEVGALGTREIPAGAYAYTGSALGSGGFARVDRHRRVAAGDHDVRHWHVDYLLGHSRVELVGVVAAECELECAVARRLPAGPIPGFGASDCACESHLARGASERALRERVASTYRHPRRADDGEKTEGHRSEGGP